MRGGAWVRWGISAGVAGVIMWRVPMPALRSAFGAVDARWFVLALGCVLAMLAARWIRWHRLLVAGGVKVSRRDSAQSLLGGFTLSVVTPGRIGEWGRCLFAAPSDRPAVLLLNIFDRLLDIWALGSWAVIGAFAVAPRPYGVFALGVWLAFLPVAMSLPGLVGSLAHLSWWKDDFREKLRDAARVTEKIPTAPFAAWALVSTSLDMLTFYFLLCAFQPVPLKAALATFPWIVTAGGLPISVGGIGPREGVAALLLARYAVPSAVACDAGLLIFVFSALLPALVGGAWLAVSNPQITQMAQIWKRQTRSIQET